jgi:hypothetical protein
LGYKVTGKLLPTMLKPAPEIDAALTDTDEVPEDVTVTDFVTEEPTGTVPKLSAPVLIVNCCFGCPLADVASATQQASARRIPLHRP